MANSLYKTLASASSYALNTGYDQYIVTNDFKKYDYLSAQKSKKLKESNAFIVKKISLQNKEKKLFCKTVSFYSPFKFVKTISLSPTKSYRIIELKDKRYSTYENFCAKSLEEYFICDNIEELTIKLKKDCEEKNL